MEYKLPTNPAEAKALIDQCKFQNFDLMDWDIFSGVESEDPKICYLDNDPGDPGIELVAVIKDGSTYRFYSSREDSPEYRIEEHELEALK